MLTVRRLAADILNVGMTRVRIDTTKSEDREKLLKAASREDVKDLIKSGVIKSVPVEGQHRKTRKNKRGPGSKKAKSNKRKKTEWMKIVRAQRKFLRELVDKKYLDEKLKKSMYMKIKGNNFRSKGAMLLYLVDHGYIEKSVVDALTKEKKERRKKAAEERKKKIELLKQKRSGAGKKEKKSDETKGAKGKGDDKGGKKENKK